MRIIIFVLLVAGLALTVVFVKCSAAATAPSPFGFVSTAEGLPWRVGETPIEPAGGRSSRAKRGGSEPVLDLVRRGAYSNHCTYRRSLTR